MHETDLRALRDKYERMLRLRTLHARAKEEADFVEPDPRAAMAELARRFPGALRELDELPLDVLRARLDELDAAERDASCIASWMIVHATFHRLARGALAVKRWLGGRALTPELEGAFARALASNELGDAADARLWAGDLAAIASPPRGRVMDVVHARLARELQVDVASARAAVLPPRASLRRRRS